MIQITRTDLNFEREPMAAPWGFKGGFLTEIWQSVALLRSAEGGRGIGLGVQSVLWSDSRVFASCSESAGNALMLLMSAHALRAAKEEAFESPLDLLDRLLPLTHDYGKLLSGRPDLRLTFALNALVAVDNAAWMLYAEENKLQSFDDLIPHSARAALAARNAEVISVPAIGYAMSVEEIQKLVADGYYLLKIKIGSDPDKDGDLDKMLEWDRRRMTAIHAAVGEHEAVRYYLDANGRYDTLDRVFRLLDTLEAIGALEKTVLLEEPFPEEVKVDVSGIPVRVVADESAHTDRDAHERIDLGYGAIALKPIAKTLSMSFRIAQVAYERGTPCFCADLTVNPILVDWNKSMAARLAPLPELDGGALENNGFQNYKNWQTMESYHPRSGAPWTTASQGVFHLDEDFYQSAGGMFLPSAHYAALVRSSDG